MFFYEINAVYETFEKFPFKAIGADLAKLRWPPVFKFVGIAVHFPYFVYPGPRGSLLILSFFI